jgi:hypothetical protein
LIIVKEFALWRNNLQDQSGLWVVAETHSLYGGGVARCGRRA